jgi:hypothetical protein
MPLRDIMSIWYRNLGDSEDEGPSGHGMHELNEASVDDLIYLDADEDEEADMPELLAYRDFISKVPAYEWLLANVYREILLASAEPNLMDAIRRMILHFLPSSHKVSRKASVEAYKVVYKIEWDLLAFVKEQEYTEEPDEAVEKAITLTGSANDAQALTCAQYLRQTWPSAGEHIIRLLKNVARSETGHRHACKSPLPEALLVQNLILYHQVTCLITLSSLHGFMNQTSWLRSLAQEMP